MPKMIAIHRSARGLVIWDPHAQEAMQIACLTPKQLWDGIISLLGDAVALPAQAPNEPRSIAGTVLEADVTEAAAESDDDGDEDEPLDNTPAGRQRRRRQEGEGALKEIADAALEEMGPLAQTIAPHAFKHGQKMIRGIAKRARTPVQGKLLKW